MGGRTIVGFTLPVDWTSQHTTLSRSMAPTHAHALLYWCTAPVSLPHILKYQAGRLTSSQIRISFSSSSLAVIWYCTVPGSLARTSSLTCIKSTASAVLAESEREGERVRILELWPGLARMVASCISLMRWLLKRRRRTHNHVAHCLSGSGLLD